MLSNFNKVMKFLDYQLEINTLQNFLLFLSLPKIQIPAF